MHVVMHFFMHVWCVNLIKYDYEYEVTDCVCVIKRGHFWVANESPQVLISRSQCSVQIQCVLKRSDAVISHSAKGICSPQTSDAITLPSAHPYHHVSFLSCCAQNKRLSRHWPLSHRNEYSGYSGYAHSRDTTHIAMQSTQQCQLCKVSLKKWFISCNQQYRVAE